MDLSQTLISLSKYDNIRMLAPINAGHRILNALNEIFRMLYIDATVVENGRLRLEQLSGARKSLFTPGDGSIIIHASEKKFVMRMIPVCPNDNKQATLLQVDIVGLHRENLCYFNERCVAVARILGQGFTVRELNESQIGNVTTLSSKPMEPVKYAVFN